MVNQISVILADDHPIFRAGVRQAIEKESGITVVGEAENGEEALAAIMNLRPGVAILDVQMPRMTGLDVAKRIEHLKLQTQVILLTMLDDKKVFFDAIDAGVRGYVLKDSAVSELHKAIVAVSEGRHYISPSLSGLLVDRRNSPSLPAGLHDLTPTELRILKLVAELKTNQEIADELFISKRTVENHRVNITKKLELSGSNALLKIALKHKSQL